MQRFDSVGGDLVVGTTVRATIISHERWGGSARVLGHETVSASVDAGAIDSLSGRPRALPEEYPPVSEQVDAVVQEISRYHPPVWIRLTMRAADLHEFSSPCGCCGQLTILSPGGDGVTVDVRSSEGPGCASFAAHRSCLAGRLNPRLQRRPRPGQHRGPRPTNALRERERTVLTAAATAGRTPKNARDHLHAHPAIAHG
ncbi:hypothetical protein FJK98_21860 [Micromonospora sp. HM134]|uniref:hypothetical protein n=1 Tax=Micromonospora sp. HM134 TaxID=2583243 RepID=UPI0011987836|nr:hypothetical protein [Micromonospora sp. HM134]QDY09464.1 hypothetical protein FJK98_21860 [Micromonospora sp. HM134]